MTDTLNIAATGMRSQETYIDIIANNLANANTSSFKKDVVNFADLLYRQQVNSPSFAPGTTTRLNGYGMIVSGVEKVFDEGDLKKTNNPLDVAIGGNGFVEVTLVNGDSAYMRGGRLKVDTQGRVVTSGGLALKSEIYVPADAKTLIIRENGMVSAVVGNEVDPIELGQLEMASFMNPAGLEAMGDGMYQPTNASGEAFFGYATEDGFGRFVQGFQESSNVNMIDEMVSLVMAQRAYQANAKMIQAADQMLATANELRR